MGYWPLIQTPGVAYVVNTDTGYSSSAVLNNALLSCWPAVLLVFVTSLLAGFLMWILVSCYTRPELSGPETGNARFEAVTQEESLVLRCSLRAPFSYPEPSGFLVSGSSSGETPEILRLRTVPPNTDAFLQTL